MKHDWNPIELEETLMTLKEKKWTKKRTDDRTSVLVLLIAAKKKKEKQAGAELCQSQLS